MKKAIIVTLCICAAALYVYSTVSHERDEIKHVCQSAIGLTVVQLAEVAKGKHLKLSGDNKIGTLHGSKTYGRIVCLIKYDDGVVTNAEYNFSD